MTATNIITVAGRPLDLLPVQAGVQPSGGGRPIKERYTVAGVLIRNVGPVQARRIAFQSPGGGGTQYVISDDDKDFLLALYADGSPFSLSIVGRYDVTGSWSSCLFDGHPVFRPLITPGYQGYDFAVHIGQG
jgi:hypothetical protein